MPLVFLAAIPLFWTYAGAQAISCSERPQCAGFNDDVATLADRISTLSNNAWYQDEQNICELVLSVPYVSY